MRIRWTAVSLVVLVLIAATIVRAQQGGKPAMMVTGLWEITMQSVSPVAGPPITHRVCIDRALFSPPDPPKSKPSEDCQVQGAAGASNEMAYSVHCSKGQTSSSWRFTYLGDHFDGTATITTTAGAIHQTYTGKRIGPCDDPPDQPVTTTGH